MDPAVFQLEGSINGEGWQVLDTSARRPTSLGVEHFRLGRKRYGDPFFDGVLTYTSFLGRRWNPKP